MRTSVTLLLLYAIYSNAKEILEDDEEYNPSVDVLSNPSGSVHVPFGHIFRDGIEDPKSGLKLPQDLLEMNLRTPRNRYEAAKLLKDTPPDRILRIDKSRFKNFAVEEDLETEAVQMSKKNGEGPRWLDFEDIHARNMANPARAPPPLPSTNIVRKYEPHSQPLEIAGAAKKFELEHPNPYKDVKWTNCTDFSKKSSTFHPKDIVDIDWTPFFVWTNRLMTNAVPHRFSYPTKKIVQEYKKLYFRHLNRPLDWEQPKLILQESIEMLLIADPRDRRGLFHGVPKRPLPTNPDILKLVQFTVPRIRIKIVDPYLAMMFCDDYYANIMASPGNEPQNDQERIEEASTLNFTGIGFPVSRDLEEEIKDRMLVEEHNREKEQQKLIKAHEGRIGVEFDGPYNK